MSEVNRYGTMGSLVLATDGLLKVYPGMDLFVRASDYEASLAREAADRLRADVAVADCNDAEAAGLKVGELLANRTEERDAAMGREAALREELGSKCEIIKEFHASEALIRESLGKARRRRDEVIDERDALQQRLTDAEKRALSLAAFAKEMVDAAFEGGSLDGSDIQDIAVKHGLLRIENRTEECGEVCACAGFGFPIECYRKTDLIALKLAEGEGS